MNLLDKKGAQGFLGESLRGGLKRLFADDALGDETRAGEGGEGASVGDEAEALTLEAAAARAIDQAVATGLGVCVCVCFFYLFF